jgi:hydroxymethylpyrimidine pyrophosphatase-like HAD family hydrolase
MDGRVRPPARVDLFGPPERMQPAMAALPDRFPHLQVMQVIGHLEVTRAGVNKGSAVRRLAQYLGIPLSAVMVIGDDVNDLSMFAVAGLSVAMGNSHPTVKYLAGAVAPDNSQGGFAWAVHRYVLAAGPA